MNDGTMHHDGAGHGEGYIRALASASLRAIDGGMRVLQRLRDRIAAPDEEASSRDDRRGGRRAAVDERPEVQAAEPTRAARLLHGALVVLLCLLLGGAIGTLLSYRGFSKLLDSRQAIIDFMQDEIALSKKEEALSVEAKAKYQIELGEYRKQLRESQYETEEYKGKVEELNNQLLAMKRVEPPVPQDGARAGATRSAGRSPPQKTGNCVAGTADVSGMLVDCIDKFNRP